MGNHLTLACGSSRNTRRPWRWMVAPMLALLSLGPATALGEAAQERMVEWTIESHKIYGDPFNDVDVDVIFEKDGQRWRVPTFWRGGNRWTVRFAPPEPGSYRFHLESTDRGNPDLNGHAGSVTITPYGGDNLLFRGRAIRVSSNGRYFEHSNGTPFYWLGDTWWSGLSSRLSWDGFQELTQDRKTKGFTVVQIVAGLVPPEEQPPSDPGYCNEGGCVWDPGFHSINPEYFDYADRRIQYLLNAEITPAIVGAWSDKLAQMGLDKLKRHWRYVIARYGAYPVFWIAGGEVFDPPQDSLREFEHRLGPDSEKLLADLKKHLGEWTEVVRYIRATDPYHHPLTVHEVDPPFDRPIQDEKLTDFDLFQPAHQGWPSLATEVTMLNKHYARTTIVKPLVVGEVGYEGLGATHWEDFQRAAFWLAMLNGAAGYTYGAVATWQAYDVEKQLQRERFSFLTWREGMNLPGSYQVGLGSKLLRGYSWWNFQPHPEWVTPHGTTLLEPNDQVTGFDIDLSPAGELLPKPLVREEDLPLGEWKNHGGTFRLPYAAGIPRELRIIYLPYSLGLRDYPDLIVHALEQGIRYQAYYWEPGLGIKVDLGVVESTDPRSSGKLELPRGDRKLYDARGEYRGQLRGPGWDDYGSQQHVDGGTYYPAKPPTVGDWVLVLEAQGRS